MSLEIWGSWLEWKMKFCGFEQSFAAFVPAWGALGWKFNLAAPLLSTPVTCECELQAYSGICTAWPPKKSHTHKLMQFRNIHFSFSLGLRSGLCGGQSMCENDVSRSLNHSFTIWARWIVAFFSWNMSMPPGKKTPLMEKKKKTAHSVYSGNHLTLFLGK